MVIYEGRRGLTVDINLLEYSHKNRPCSVFIFLLSRRKSVVRMRMIYTPPLQIHHYWIFVLFIFFSSELSLEIRKILSSLGRGRMKLMFVLLSRYLIVYLLLERKCVILYIVVLKKAIDYVIRTFIRGLFSCNVFLIH